jgi:hypothetical protein
MFHVGRFRLFHAGRRALRRERVFRDRTKPLEIYDDFELIDKYRFDRQSIMMICDILQDDKDLDGEFIAIQENLRNLPIYLKAKGHLKCFLSLRTFMNTT